MTDLDITAARSLVALNDAAVDPTGTLTLYLGQALDELERMRPVYQLACDLQDSDQCENHSTGDDCATGTVEHALFEALVIARQQEPERTDPLERGEKKRSRPSASTDAHVLNDHDECVSWCPPCRANVSRGLNPDGTDKESARG